MDHKVDVVAKPDHCAPSIPPPSAEQREPCEGEIHGTIKMECCCDHLHTRTFRVPLNPMTDQQMGNYIAATANAWEGAGYLIMAHSLVDTGGGWMLILTIGWYA